MEVGDRAVRIAALTRGSNQFLAETRQVYLQALLRARAERSREGVTRAADFFEKLGDVDMARQARRIAESLS